jgi:hypothetical protein
MSQIAKGLSVSLAEWDRESISRKSQTAQTIPAINIIHPMMVSGIKKMPILLNQGKRMIFIICFKPVVQPIQFLHHSSHTSRKPVGLSVYWCGQSGFGAVQFYREVCWF